MDDIIKKYVEVSKTVVTPFGFKQKRSTFVRIVNDVMQNISVEKINSGWECRVAFAVIPLCIKIEKDYIIGGAYSHYLKKFETAIGTIYEPMDSWKFDKHSDTSITLCVKEITRYITKHLLPFFERANNCETALPELIKLEKNFNDNRKETLKHRGIEDRAGPYAELNLLDSSKYYMSLKNGDYDFALKILHAILIQNSDSYNSMSEMGYLTDEDRVRRENKMSALKDDIRLLEEKDFSYFQRLLKENEAYSRETLKGFLKQPIPETI